MLYNAPMLVDTHAHLMDSKFLSDLPDVLKRTRQSGVQKMVNVGCTVRDCEESSKMALQYDFLWGTQGLHPSDFADFSEDLMRKFYDIAKSNSKIVAIGETGLDYHYKNADPFRQQESLRSQMRLARELDLPVIIHCRQAERDMLKILQEFLHVRCVMHCFSQDREYAQNVLKMGHMFSFSGTLTYPKSDEVRTVAAILPSDRILIETDSPYLPPQSRRGKRNEPSCIVETAQKLAEVRGVSFDEIAVFTTKNAENFFGI